MAKSRHRSIGNSRPSRGRLSRASGTPLTHYRKPAFTVSRLQLAARPLVHPELLSRTVRSPLIRTVPRDTTSRFNRRPSPDLPHRTIGRSSSWTTYMEAIASVPFSDRTERYQDLKRPLTCARRAIRREVLFALRQGNGAGSRGVPKSKEKCQ